MHRKEGEKIEILTDEPKKIDTSYIMHRKEGEKIEILTDEPKKK